MNFAASQYLDIILSNPMMGNFEYRLNIPVALFAMNSKI